jgi:hypothetical protein
MVARCDVLALFTRRGESEVLVNPADVGVSIVIPLDRSAPKG